jgi:hypothetical protein
MDEYRNHARRCLEAQGFQAECIDETDEERADLLVSDSASKYVVEVKGKEASEAYQELCAEASKNEMATLERPVAYWNRLDAIVGKANAQLVSTPSEMGAFRLLWVACLMGDVDFIHQQFEYTLYGQRLVSAFDKNNVKSIPSILPCYYYDFSAFYRYREVDAVILSGPESGRLCINEFSPRTRDFRYSRMYNLLPDAAIIDPIRLEESGKALAIRADIDRKDEKAKWTYLHDTYGYMTAPLQEWHFKGMISVPISDG